MNIRFFVGLILICSNFCIVIYATNKNINNNTNLNIQVEFDENFYPIVSHPYLQNSKIILFYYLKPMAYHKKTIEFPYDFMLEIPHEYLKPNPAQRLDQVTVLGSHNNFANKEAGFLYFQHLLSTENQLKLGVRMLRPAWHNPMKNIFNLSRDQTSHAILCHASSDKSCYTVSLATRGVKEHQLVSEENKILLDFLIKNPTEFLIVGLNNYLSDKQTDLEIERIKGLKDFIITETDLQNLDYQKEWNGFWPTINWMIKHNKRLIVFNDYGSTKYTIAYKKYVKMNQYGTAKITDAAKLREGTGILDYSLIEISWFQDISLSHAAQKDIDNSNWLTRTTIKLINKKLNYMPIKQDKSLLELFSLINACKKTKIIKSGLMVNILLLDFSVTEGQGMEFVNLMNILQDQKQNLDFVNLGGFCYQKQEIPQSWYQDIFV